MTEPEDIAAAIVGHLKAALEEIEALAMSYQKAQVPTAIIAGKRHDKGSLGPSAALEMARRNRVRRHHWWRYPTCKRSDKFCTNGIPWITPADLTGYSGTYIQRGARYLSEKGYKNSSARILPAATVLFSSRAPIGYCVIACKRVTTNQGFKSIIPLSEYTSEYLRYYLLSAKKYAESLASGTTFKEFSGARMATLAMPIAPLAEQRRIVAKLDNLTGHSGARALNSENSQAHSKVSSAILTAAFAGELVGARGVTPTRREPQHVSLGDLVKDIRYGTSKKCSPEPKGTPVLRIPNVGAGVIDFHDLKYATFTSKEMAKLCLSEGDVLVVRSNGSPDLVGRPALVTGEAVGMAYAGYLIRLRPDRSRIEPKFLVAMLTSPQTRNVIGLTARSTSGVHNINSAELASLQIPKFSLDAQRAIVNRIEAAFVWLDRVAAEHSNVSRLISKLDQAILVKAFRGELLPGGPANERHVAISSQSLADRPELTKPKRSISQPKITAPGGSQAMSKNRIDIDVKGKPYLASKLNELGEKTNVDELYVIADLPLVDFYKQLSEEFERGWVRKSGDQVEAA